MNHLKRNNPRFSGVLVAVLSWVLLSSGNAVFAADQCAPVSTTIAQVQGATAESPLLGQPVRIGGVVTASWQQAGELGGFFLQSEQPDDNPLTSEAIFVQSNAQPFVRVGQRLVVSGTVSEVHQLTQLQDVSQIQSCGTASIPQAMALHLPLTQAQQLETLEGMQIQLQQTMVVNGTYQLGRHGQFDIAPSRIFTPTQVVAAGAEAQALAQQNRLSLLTVDDNQAPNPARIPYPTAGLSAEHTLRSGDEVAPFTAIVSEYRGNYRLQPTTPLQFTARNLRPKAPAPAAADELRIAAFNVLNYFNGEGSEQSFPTTRGAKTTAQFAVQHEKIVNALLGLKADIIGLMEIENDGYRDDSAIFQLTESLRQRTGQKWDFITPSRSLFGDDAITNGLIYRSDKVYAYGAAVTSYRYPFNQRSRLPLIQVFNVRDSDMSLAVAVNHFKSKGSCPDKQNANANNGDGQGCWNEVRVRSAQELVRVMHEHRQLEKVTARILLGDFNAYAQEEPLRVFQQHGYVNLIDDFEPSGYSYVYASQAGSLDHIFVSKNLVSQVSQLRHWSINADEPIALQYQNIDNYPERVDTSPYRASDHDPLYLDIKIPPTDVTQSN